MIVDVNLINNVLVEIDIEGLIEAGAPVDEYSSEAKFIKEELGNITKEQFNIARLYNLIEGIWAKYFNLEGEELEWRKPNLIKATNDIFEKIIQKY